MTSPLGRLQNCPAPTYQDKLADLIRQVKPLIVVETGFCNGFGAEYILKALDDNGAGHLYSIDPMDVNHCTNGATPEPHTYDANPIVHPRFTLIRGLSSHVMVPLVERIGPFDMFIHDSDHAFECQTWEYEAAWSMVKPGGIIVSDDCYWGDPPHLAWDKFLIRYGITKRNIIGNAQWITRT